MKSICHEYIPYTALTDFIHDTSLPMMPTRCCRSRTKKNFRSRSRSRSLSRFGQSEIGVTRTTKGDLQYRSSFGDDEASREFPACTGISEHRPLCQTWGQLCKFLFSTPIPHSLYHRVTHPTTTSHAFGDGVQDMTVRPPPR